LKPGPLPTMVIVSDPEQPVWTADVIDGFEACTFELAGGSDPEGPVVATLVRRRPEQASGRAVLYVHGYNDYFFQAHLADEFIERGWTFYALDLRKHGRSLRPGQTPSLIGDLHQYFEEITAAIDVVTGVDRATWLAVFAHSTGGLTTSLYLAEGARRHRVNALVLNSPFLDFNLPVPVKQMVPAVALIGRWFPLMAVSGPSSPYGESIHKSKRGEWSYDLAWKPLNGLAPRAGWIRAIRRAHRQVQGGLSIRQPILVLRSARSVHGREWTDEFAAADSVLGVDDIARLAPRLGVDVRVVAIDGALHDVMLSAPAAREEALRVLFDWLPAP
jgi:alpha-beta hydrolase superfamily lysophospholipase